MPTAQDVVARLEKARAARSSFRVETTMDYWLGKTRAKGTVFVMGTSKRQVRFAAIKPDGNTLVDMACDGTNFTFVDFQNNCSIAGPCNKQSIATLLRVELEPDDFHDLAQGTPPVLDNATGTVTWDPNKGYERVSLQGADGKQSITIDARENRFDVVASELVDPSGKVVWSVENTDFQSVKDVNGVAHRVPGKTRFKSPTQQADLLVEWKADERAINLELPPAKFVVPIPQGLATCGGAQPTPPAGKTSPAP
jgi:hypothetical protein